MKKTINCAPVVLNLLNSLQKSNTCPAKTRN